MPYAVGGLLKRSLYSSRAAYIATDHSAHRLILHCPSVLSYSTAALTTSAAVLVLLASSIRETFCVGPPVTRVSFLKKQNIRTCFSWRKGVGSYDALFSIRHGYASVNNTFCMGTAVVTALLLCGRCGYGFFPGDMMSLH